MRRVLVSHPHAAAVSVETAVAFEAAGRLAQFATGAGAVEGTLRGRALARLAQRWPLVANRLWSGLRPGHVAASAGVELAARLAGRAGRVLGLEVREYEALFGLHDAVLARRPWPRGTDAVYAYEDGALHTFRRAARGGVARILDQPLPHWRTLARLWEEESRRWPGAMGSEAPREPDWKRARKDEELRLADVASVASRFTEASLRETGFAGPIVVTPYGFPVDRFHPRQQAPEGPFTVLAVGTQDLRKGTPYLLEAWRLAGLKDARLRLIGPLRLTGSFLRPYAGLFEHVPRTPKALLPGAYQEADLLAFPTLGDGFGLVIQEAMCCATPVLTTRCGGGPECITDGVDGLLVEERSTDALVERLRWASTHRDRLHELGLAARRRAERGTWSAFGQHLVESLGTATQARAVP